ncbi:hypothetical protein Mycsm_05570 [Mycobacterium sp. JS623]|nr:hypothetical protein Mycsm_05570 [Mycobacterium sp. JS623]
MRTFFTAIKVKDRNYVGLGDARLAAANRARVPLVL